jgi:hypothetical protein
VNLSLICVSIAYRRAQELWSIPGGTGKPPNSTFVDFPPGHPRWKFDKLGDICTHSAKAFGTDHDEGTWQTPTKVFDQLPEYE